MSKDLNKIENDIEHMKDHIGKLYLRIEALEAMILKIIKMINDLNDRIEYLESDIEKIKHE